MKAQDIMVSPVVTVTPETSVQELAQLLIDRRISGVPVLDAQGTLVGIVSEGDLLRRTEAATERRSSWWLELGRSSWPANMSARIRAGSATSCAARS